MHDTVAPNRPPLWLAIRRGLACRCPNCGGGRLFASYLKQVDACAACGEPLGHIRSRAPTSLLQASGRRAHL